MSLGGRQSSAPSMWSLQNSRGKNAEPCSRPRLPHGYGPATGWPHARFRGLPSCRRTAQPGQWGQGSAAVVSADQRQTRPASAPREKRRRVLEAPRAVTYVGGGARGDHQGRSQCAEVWDGGSGWGQVSSQRGAGLRGEAGTAPHLSHRARVLLSWNLPRRDSQHQHPRPPPAR